jgi:hypothetical protein
MPAGGGLLQLVATGKQDLFLTGNPQISFFKMVYRRHTNFATESQAMYFSLIPMQLGMHSFRRLLLKWESKKLIARQVNGWRFGRSLRHPRGNGKPLMK